MSDASKGDHIVQVRIGDDDSDEWGLVPFEILKVYSNQMPTAAVPWHTAGGDWTFFDCRTTQPPAAIFTVGVRSQSQDGRPVAWGEAMVLVADRGEGTKLLDCIGRAFSRKPPPERPPQPLEPWKFNTAVLGDGMKREPGGGFSPGVGNWSATKWFLERDGFSAEVFFNYSLNEMKGEFSEKDPDYREDLLAILAIIARDGPRSERTPQSDPNLTDTGPTFGTGQLAAKSVRQFQFGPGGKRAIFSTRSPSAPSVLFSFVPDKPEQPEEVARVKQELSEFVVLDPDVNQVLIVELLPREKGVISSEDPKRLWWVDREANELRELTGPWEAKSVRLPDNPVSPGGRFIAITSWRPRAGNSRGKYQVIHILDRESKTARTIEIPNQSSDPVGWVGSGGAIRLAFLKNRSWDKNAKEDWYLAEPETGRFAPADKPSIAVGAQARQRSPDGGLIAAIRGNDELTLTDANTGESRSFKFHEEDRRFVHEEAFEWMSARYLLLHLGRLAFLDVQSLKMSYPLPLKDEARGHTFSPDFRWVLWQTPDDALYVSPVVLPENGH